MTTYSAVTWWINITNHTLDLLNAPVLLAAVLDAELVVLVALTRGDRIVADPKVNSGLINFERCAAASLGEGSRILFLLAIGAVAVRLAGVAGLLPK